VVGKGAVVTPLWHFLQLYFFADVLDHDEAGRPKLELLSDLLSKGLLRSAAAGADQFLGRGVVFLALSREVPWDLCAPIPLLLALLLALVQGGRRLLVRRFVDEGRRRLLSLGGLFKGQLELSGVYALGSASEDPPREGVEALLEAFDRFGIGRGLRSIGRGLRSIGRGLRGLGREGDLRLSEALAQRDELALEVSSL
jgi:hypothetical protein